MPWTRKAGQTDQIAHNASGQSVAITFPQAVVVGDTIIAMTRYDNTVVGPAPDNMVVTDNLGNSWSKVGNAFFPDEFRVTVWQCNVTNGGSMTATMNTTSPATGITIAGMEYVGTGGGAFDQTANNTGTSTSANSGSTPTTTAADELLIGIVGDSFNGTPYTATGGWTKRAESNSSNGRCAFFDRIVSATGTYAMTATLSVSNAWCALICTFKEATQPEPGPKPVGRQFYLPVNQRAA